MNPNDLTLSWMLWLCVGFLVGYRYHVLKVREIVARRTKRVAEQLRADSLNRLLAQVAIASAEIPPTTRAN